MCELVVFLEGEIVFRDATYVKADANRVLVRDILGKSKTVENCRIAEVDVASERLVLAKTESEKHYCQARLRIFQLKKG